MLKGKKILVGVTGSIAVYKSLLLVRELVKAEAEVKVIMTKTATEFVSPLSFSVLSKHKVFLELNDNDSWTDHVHLGRWADVFIIAPLTANTLSKMASGLCDNLLLATYLSATCPVWVAPAMDEDMWLHFTATSNISKLEKYGHKILSVGEGSLASGLFGRGRMAEPEEILEQLVIFFEKGVCLSGKKVLITAGPTYEPIDPVRFIGNRSSGKMGIHIAEEFLNLGAEVTLVLGPSNQKTTSKLEIIRVETAQEVYEACALHFPRTDITVMCAAVADYTPVQKLDNKIKKQDDFTSLQLKKTVDILQELGEKKTKNQILCGFALETNNEEENALLKLKKKHLDLIVLNSMKDEGAGFEHDTNKITIFDKHGKKAIYPLQSKQKVAGIIVTAIIALLHE